MTNTANLTITPQHADRHAVFAYLANGERARVSVDDMTYGEALTMWQRIDQRLRNTNEPVRINGSQVQWFNVRSMDDPDWNTAPKSNLIWGFVAADFGAHGVFTKRANTAAKLLTPSQRDALLSAAKRQSQCKDRETLTETTFSLRYETHAKTKQSLATKGLLRDSYATALTPLGEAVARVLFAEENNGKTVEEANDEFRNQVRGRKIREAAAKSSRRRRAAAIAAKLPQGESHDKLRERLTGEGYGSLIRDTRGGTIRLTLEELEALVGIK